MSEDKPFIGDAGNASLIGAGLAAFLTAKTVTAGVSMSGLELLSLLGLVGGLSLAGLSLLVGALGLAGKVRAPSRPKAIGGVAINGLLLLVLLPTGLSLAQRASEAENESRPTRIEWEPAEGWVATGLEAGTAYYQGPDQVMGLKAIYIADREAELAACWPGLGQSTVESMEAEGIRLLGPPIKLGECAVRTAVEDPSDGSQTDTRVELRPCGDLVLQISHFMEPGAPSYEPEGVVCSFAD
jgi:hypothetical protein